MSFSKIFKGLSVAGVIAASVCAATGAQATTLMDTYYGGTDTYNNPGDIIGPANVFDIISATAIRTGTNGDTLQIVIKTNYAGGPGTPAADGTGYGALFLTPGVNAWQPTGSASNHYAADVYVPGEWAYAATLPMDPGTMSGTGGLYATSGGTVVTSNVGTCNYQTYPINSSCPWYFRQGQAVQFTPGATQTPVASETWAIQGDTITFNIIDNHLLGDSFSLAWAMTCANDVIQGQINIPLSEDPVDEAPTWSVLMAGLLFITAYARRRGVAGTVSMRA